MQISLSVYEWLKPNIKFDSHANDDWIAIGNKRTWQSNKLKVGWI